MKIFLLSKRKLCIILFMVAAALVVCFFMMGSFASSEDVIAEPIYQGKTEKNMIALAINVDWGEDVLENMLRVLKEQDVKATFFVTGRFAEKFPDLVKKIATEGHEIGNHGYSHPHPDQISVAENKEDILKTEKILEKVTGTKPVLYAPPYGEHGNSCLQAAEEAGYQTILWTADTVDWQQPAPDTATLVQRVTGEKLTKGGIILMHPKEHTITALPEIIKTIREKGYTCGKVSEVL